MGESIFITLVRETMLDYRKAVLKGRLVPGNRRLALVIYFMPKHFPVKPPMLSSILRLMLQLFPFVASRLLSPALKTIMAKDFWPSLLFSGPHQIDVHHTSRFLSPLPPHTLLGKISARRKGSFFLFPPFLFLNTFAYFLKSATLRAEQGLGQEMGWLKW